MLHYLNNLSNVLSSTVRTVSDSAAAGWESVKSVAAKAVDVAAPAFKSLRESATQLIDSAKLATAGLLSLAVEESLPPEEERLPEQVPIKFAFLSNAQTPILISIPALAKQEVLPADASEENESDNHYQEVAASSGKNCFSAFSFKWEKNGWLSTRSDEGEVGG